ncbi:Ras association domain family member 6 [Rhinolophus ferrumequinum]|uniref:Ras association domain family member 6 n=1 Tax=Rhinolophus ferrumequinum TaxID=59479 RepID=A0A7J7ZF94_RHIFE|nr:Ras association domain family member 6 [Rhinolophus ferrumequinum]
MRGHLLPGTLLDPEHSAMNQTRPLPSWGCLLKRELSSPPLSQVSLSNFSSPQSTAV